MNVLTFEEVKNLTKRELERGPIFIGGPSGGGKSWLSTQLGLMFDVPIVNLDRYSKHEGDKYDATGYPIHKKGIYNGWPTNLKEIQESLGFSMIVTPMPSFQKYLEIHTAKVKSLEGLKNKTRSREWHLKTSRASEADYRKSFSDYVKLTKKLLPGVRIEIMKNDITQPISKGWFEY